MNVANTTTELEMAAGELQQAVSRDESTFISTPQQILQSALDALSEGKLSEAMKHFDEDGCFRFIDHALTLEFTDRPRLTEFFEKSRALFPDTALEIVSVFGDGDHAIAQWKLAATQNVPYGSISYRFPISLFGATVVHVEKGKIVQW